MSDRITSLQTCSPYDEEMSNGDHWYIELISCIFAVLPCRDACALYHIATRLSGTGQYGWRQRAPVVNVPVTLPLSVSATFPPFCTMYQTWLLQWLDCAIYIYPSSPVDVKYCRQQFIGVRKRPVGFRLHGIDLHDPCKTQSSNIRQKQPACGDLSRTQR